MESNAIKNHDTNRHRPTLHASPFPSFHLLKLVSLQWGNCRGSTESPALPRATRLHMEYGWPETLALWPRADEKEGCFALQRCKHGAPTSRIRLVHVGPHMRHHATGGSTGDDNNVLPGRIAEHAADVHVIRGDVANVRHEQRGVVVLGLNDRAPPPLRRACAG